MAMPPTAMSLEQTDHYREWLLQHLQWVEKQIADSDKFVAAQQAIIARLEQGGYDTAQAEAFLAHLKELRELNRGWLAQTINKLLESGTETPPV